MDALSPALVEPPSFYPLRVKTSTPTREFKLGDQRYYNVPCPHCGELIVFKFSLHSERYGDCGIRWWRVSEDESKTGGEWDMEKVRQNTFYKAQCCGGEIFDRHKPAMLRAGRWIPTNLNAEPGRRSYHLNSPYALLLLNLRKDRSRTHSPRTRTAPLGERHLPAALDTNWFDPSTARTARGLAASVATHRGA